MYSRLVPILEKYFQLFFSIVESHITGINLTAIKLMAVAKIAIIFDITTFLSFS